MIKYIAFHSFILFLIVLTQYGCSGGSPSGRRSYQKKNFENDATSDIDKNINSNGDQDTNNATTNSTSLGKLYNKLKHSVFLVYTSDGKEGKQGSGFFISKDGLAVSNYHVFEGTSKGLEIIETLDGKQFKISEILEKSKKNDFIIFRVNIGNHVIDNPLPIVSQAPHVGDDVFAIGNPRGLESTLSKGIVSAYRRNNNLIQTTTEITHGSSGGPLINMKGEVIGITTSGLGEANLNFAVNIKSLKIYRFF